MLSSLFGDRLYKVLPKYYISLSIEDQKYERKKEQWRTASEKYRNKIKKLRED